MSKRKGLFFCFILGIFFLFAGVGLAFRESNFVTNSSANTPVFDPPVSVAPLNPERILEIVNQKRTEEKLLPLTKDPGLDFVAYIRAVNIMENGDFSHGATKSGALTYNNVANRLLTKYQYIGENLALGDFGNEEMTLVKAWLDSPRHREILLGNYNKVGVFTLHGDFNKVKTTVTVWVSVLE